MVNHHVSGVDLGDICGIYAETSVNGESEHKLQGMYVCRFDYNSIRNSSPEPRVRSRSVGNSVGRHII